MIAVASLLIIKAATRINNTVAVCSTIVSRSKVQLKCGAVVPSYLTKRLPRIVSAPENVAFAPRRVPVWAGREAEPPSDISRSSRTAVKVSASSGA